MLFFYSAVQLKPLTAVIQDALAHTFLEMHHIATTHHQHGHHHLQDEIQDVTEAHHSDSSEKIPASQKSNEEISTHVSEEFNIKFTNPYSFIHHLTTINQHLVSVIIPINSPPPKRISNFLNFSSADF